MDMKGIEEVSSCSNPYLFTFSRSVVYLIVELYPPFLRYTCLYPNFMSPYASTNLLVHDGLCVG